MTRKGGGRKGRDGGGEGREDSRLGTKSNHTPLTLRPPRSRSIGQRPVHRVIELMRQTDMRISDSILRIRKQHESTELPHGGTRLLGFRSGAKADRAGLQSTGERRT